MHIVFIIYSHMYNKTDRKVKSTIMKDYCTFGVSITELQVRYKRSFRMETRTEREREREREREIDR